MPHTTMRQHRTIRKGTWQPTSCAMTITNPVGQQLTPTHHCCSTRGSKREQNLHTEGCSSPCNPPTCGRQIRGIRNRRTDRHTRNHQTITGNLCATPLPSTQASIIPHLSTSQGQTPPYPSTSQPTTPQPSTPQIPPPAATAATNADEMVQ